MLEEAPKPRSRRRKPAAEAGETVEAVAAADEAPKPKGRARKRPAPEAVAAAAEAAVGIDSPDDAPAPKRRARKRPATASIVSEDAVIDVPTGKEDDDALSSPTRRRGRIDGRRRSRAKAQADAEVSD